MNSPNWLTKAIFYEIYPQSFYDSNHDGIGDLTGIIKKLNYISNIGFNALWLNPIFKSSFWDAGYDVMDYYQVDKRYGGNKALYHLIKECKKRNIRLLLDLVPGHTSILHPWFKKSSLSDHKAYSKRYIWTKDYFNADTSLRWIGGFTKRQGGALVNFYSIQPALNYGFFEIKHPEYEERIEDKGPQETIQGIIDVILFWLDKGIDGFRVDMAGWLVKNDPDGLGTVKVWKQIFSKVRELYPEATFVSEWNRPERSMVAGFDMDFLLQDPFSKTNSLLTRKEDSFFRFKAPKKSTSEYMEDFRIQLDHAISHGHYVSLISDNHDNPRLRKYLNETEMLFYFAFMLTMPNVPFFYYGDEIGMPYIENMESVEGGYQRTGARVPMYWDKAKKNCGFSSADKTLIPVKGYKRKTVTDVKSSLKNSESLLMNLKKLIALRKDFDALDSDSTFELETNGNENLPLIYKRSKGDKTLVMMFYTGNLKLYHYYPTKEILFHYGNFHKERELLSFDGPSFAIAEV